MATLPRPSRHLARQRLPTVVVQACDLFRLSRYDSGEPFFGKSAANRFDDRAKTKAKRFGTCYFGLSLEVAVAETVLHDEMPIRGTFAIAAPEIEMRYLVRFNGGALTLVDLTGTSLKALVGSSAISTATPYDAQLWSMALHRHAQKVDGLLYMSRHVNNQKAVVVFDRARGKLGRPSYTPLSDAEGALRALLKLRISVKYV